MKRKPVDYVLGQQYEIAPFGRLDIVKETIRKATFVGYVQKRWGYPTSTTIKWPVFESEHYGRSILYALDNGLCAARGANIAELMADFAANHAFVGSKHETIDVDHGKTCIPKDDFVKQMAAAGVQRQDLEEDLLHGRYSMRHFDGGEIKWCPTCRAMRQTTCCACGCGNCKTCNHRWVCGAPVNIVPVNLLFPSLS